MYQERDKARLAVALSLIAGCVDGAGYIVLARLFTAHMSGNTAAFGAMIGVANWPEAAHRLFPIPLFVIGVFIGAMAVEIAGRRGVGSPLLVATSIELCLLVACVAVGWRGGDLAGSWRYYPVAALSALAMGVQNTGLRKVWTEGVRTTYISSDLTNMAEEIARRWFERVDKAKPSDRPPAGFWASIWFGFTVGAAIGGLLAARFGLRSLLAPIAGLLGVYAWGAARTIEIPASGTGG